MELKTRPLFVTTDLSETQAAAARLGVDLSLQLLGSDQAYSCTVTRLTLGEAELCYCHQQGRVRMVGEATQDCFFLCVSLSGSLVFLSEDGQCTLQPGNPIVIPAGRFEGRTNDDVTDVMLVRIEHSSARSALRSLLQHQLYGPLTFHAADEPPNPDKVRLLERFLQFLYEEADRSSPSLLFSPASIEQAEHLLATLLLETLPHSYSSEVQALGSRDAPWHLKAADEVIRERLDEMTSTSKLAAAIGVSPRMLRRAFVQMKGITPTRYLRKLRFERVHEELRHASPPETVTVIALRWGFCHLGRFAVEYRRMFSESPSQTLRAS